MKYFKLNRLFLFALGLFLLFLFACKQNQEDTTHEGGIPELKLINAKSKSEKVKITLPTASQPKMTIELTASVESLKKEDIELEFSLNGQTKKPDFALKSMDFPVAIEKGATKNVTFIVKEKEKEWKEWTCECEIKRNVLVDAKNISITLGLEDGKPAVVVENGETYKTKKDKPTLTITSKKDAVIKKVTIGSEGITPTGNRKEVTHDLAPADNIKLKIEFEDHNPKELTFTLKKRFDDLQCTECSIYTGDVFDKQAQITKHKINNFDNDGNMNSAMELSDIEYSTVKAEFIFDTPLQEAKIVECIDERSSMYTTNPSEVDKKGVFSGAVVSKQNSDGSKTPLTVKEGNKYTVYLILGFGEVSYKFQFEAEEKETITRMITLKNTNTTTIGPTNATTGLEQYNMETWQALYSGFPNFKWLGYIAQPIDGKGQFKAQYIIDANSNPEYMGGSIKERFAISPSKIAGGGGLKFFYSLTDDRNAEECHNFVMIEGYTRNNWLYASIEFDPEEKYVDSFLAFKKLLPLTQVQYSLANKWKRILKKGFILRLANESLIGSGQKSRPRSIDFEKIFDVRVQAKTYADNQENPGSSPLKIGKTQTYESYATGSPNLVMPGEELITGKEASNAQDEDIFVMLPTFTGKISDHIKSFEYTIKKDGQELKKKSIPISENTKNFVLGGDEHNTYNADEYKLENRAGLFVFKEKDTQDAEPNVYTISVVVETKDEGKEYFDFEINYKEPCELKQK